MADPGFPRGVGVNSKGGCENYYLANVSQKLHEIERIWIWGGVGASGPDTPFRSANDK